MTITLKGREIPLLFTTWEMKTVAEEIAPISQAMNLVLGRNPENPEDTSRYGSAEHLGAIAKMLTILGNAGLEDAGEAPDLTEKWVMRAMKPAELVDAVNACLAAFNDGMASEIQKEDTGPVDVTLEEMKKKKEKEN